MGRLRTKLIVTCRLLEGIDPSVKDAVHKIRIFSQSTYTTLEVAGNGIDALYLYIDQKLKKEGTTWSAAEGRQLRDMSDTNVKSFVSGVSDMRDKALSYLKEWAAYKSGLQGELERAESAVKDIDDLLSKKKKKLFKSKDYKFKLKAYEDTLNELRSKLPSLQTGLQAALENPMRAAPSEAQVKRALGIGLDSTLKELDSKKAGMMEKLLRECESADRASETTTRRIRQYEFKSELRRLREMVDETDELEEAAN